MANVIKDNGYPTMRREFNKVQREKGDKEKKKKEEAVKECPYCNVISPTAEIQKIKKDSEFLLTVSYICPNCGEVMDVKEEAKEEVGELQIVDDPYQDNVNVRMDAVEDWSELETQLSKATNKNGKKYHAYWKKRVIKDLQEKGHELKEVKKVLKKYLNNGWQLGGIVAVMDKKRGIRESLRQ